MEKVKLVYEDREEVYEVMDSFDFYRLLGEIDMHFKRVYKWNSYGWVDTTL